MTTTGTSVLGRLGSRSSFDGNARFMLDEAASAWIVDEGHLDVFAVEVENGKPSGPLHYRFSVEPGGLVCGVPPALGNPIRLMAVSAGPTVVRRVSVDELRSAAAEDPDTVGDLIETFLIAMAEPDAPARRGDKRIAPADQDIVLKAGDRATARNGVVWVSPKDGTAHVVGDPPHALTAETDYYPLTLASTLEAETQVTLSAIDCAEYVKREGAWEGLDAFLAAEPGRVREALQLAERTERARQEEGIEADRRLVSRALADIVSVIERDIDPVALADPDAPLMGAARTVARAAGIELVEPPKWMAGESGVDPLDAICRASKVRSRRVALRGTWYAEHNGPILCFEAEGRRPVAAIPTRGGLYELVDAVTGERTPVDESISDNLEPFAYQFFRPLPDRALTIRDLGAFALFELKGAVGGIVLLSALAGLLGLVMPIATGFVFKTVIPSSNPGQLAFVFVGLATTGLAAAALNLTRAYAMLRLAGRSGSAIQAAVFDRLLRLPTNFFRQFSVGDVVSRVDGIRAVNDALSGATLGSILGGLAASMNLFLLFYYSSSLAVIAIIFVAIAVAILLGATLLSMRFEERVQELAGRLAGLVLEMVSGISKIRVAGAEDRALAKWSHLYAEKVRLDRRASLYQAVVTVFNAALPLLSSLVIFMSVARLASEGQPMDTAAFIAFSAALGGFLAGAVTTSGTLVEIVYIVPLLKRAGPILEALPESSAAKPSPGALTGRIEGKHLSFRYREDGPLVIDDVSFEAEPGEFVALVGPSGSGKSTILRLILGFEQPEKGFVYFDGQDLQQIDVTAVRQQIGVVLQTSRIMAGDIFQNIVGTLPLGEEDAWAAAEAAGFADDVRDMPMGLHTVISEGASTLSGGQRQRLLIARALVAKPRIILFDEATSALDNKTQSIVTESLDQIQATRVVIAHRLSTIRDADKIYVVDRGRLVEKGTYDELMDLDGTFAALARRQIA